MFYEKFFGIFDRLRKQTLGQKTNSSRVARSKRYQRSGCSSIEQLETRIALSATETSYRADGDRPYGWGVITLDSNEDDLYLRSTQEIDSAGSLRPIIEFSENSSFVDPQGIDQIESWYKDILVTAGARVDYDTENPPAPLVAASTKGASPTFFLPDAGNPLSSLSPSGWTVPTDGDAYHFVPGTVRGQVTLLHDGQSQTRSFSPRYLYDVEDGVFGDGIDALFANEFGVPQLSTEVSFIDPGDPTDPEAEDTEIKVAITGKIFLSGAIRFTYKVGGDDGGDGAFTPDEGSHIDATYQTPIVPEGPSAVTLAAGRDFFLGLQVDLPGPDSSVDIASPLVTNTVNNNDIVLAASTVEVDAPIKSTSNFLVTTTSQDFSSRLPLGGARATVVEEFRTNTIIDSPAFGVSVADDDRTDLRSRGSVEITASGDWNADRLSVRGIESDFVFAGEVTANDQSYFLRTSSEPEPYRFVTEGEGIIRATSEAGAGVVDITLDNVEVISLADSVVHDVDLSMAVDSLRISAEGDNSVETSVTPSAFDIAIQEEDTINIEAVVRTGAGFAISAENDVQLTSSVDSFGDVVIQSKEKILGEAEISTVNGTVALSGSEVNITGGIQVLNANYDETTTDVSLTATTGPLVFGAISATNGITLTQSSPDILNTGVRSVRTVVGSKLDIVADGNIALNTNVDEAVIVSNAAVTVNEEDDAVFNVVATGLTTLTAQGVDPLGEDVNGNGLLDASEDANGNGVLDEGTALVATVRDTSQIIVSAPQGSVEVLAVTSDALTVGNLQSLNSFEAIDTRAAGDVSIRSTQGDVVVLDAPQAGVGVLNARAVSADEDKNDNGLLDTEDANGNGLLDLGEDVNGNGVLDAEDINSNGILDEGNLPGTFAYNQPGVTPSTLTAAGNGSLNDIADFSSIFPGLSATNRLRVRDVVLLRGQDNAHENGLYQITSLGDLLRPWVLTRTTTTSTTSGFPVNSRVAVQDGDFAGESFRVKAYDTTLNETPLQVAAGYKRSPDEISVRAVTDATLLGSFTVEPSQIVGASVEDINFNGVLDLSEDVGNGVLDIEDTNGNGVLDTEDTNGNGVLDVGEDLNGNGVLDTEDTNGNGVLDTEDTNGNGVLDPGEDLGNGVLDIEDTNGNGVLDTEDTNGNGVLDVGEDLNGNGVLDTEDTNGNGVLDTEDTNGNGVLDPTEDLNGNGLLDPAPNQLIVSGVAVVEGDLILVRFGAASDVSEDINGNGTLDPGEDTNGNGVLDLGSFAEHASARPNGIYQAAIDATGVTPWTLTRWTRPGETSPVEEAVVVVEDGFYRTSATGQTFTVNYDGLGLSDLEISDPVSNPSEKVQFELGSYDPRDSVDFVVSTTGATNTAAGSLGRMLELVQTNQAKDFNQEFVEQAIRFGNVLVGFESNTGTIELQQELPVISRPFILDATDRYSLNTDAIRPIVIDGSRITSTREGTFVVDDEVSGFVYTASASGETASTSPEDATRSVLRGLQVGGFESGAAVQLDSVSNVLVERMTIGLNAENNSQAVKYGIQVTGDGVGKDGPVTLLNNSIYSASISGGIANPIIGAGVLIESNPTASDPTDYVQVIGSLIGQPNGSNASGIEIRTHDGMSSLGSGAGNMIGANPLPVIPDMTVTQNKSTVEIAAADWEIYGNDLYLGQQVVSSAFPSGTVIAFIEESSSGSRILTMSQRSTLTNNGGQEILFGSGQPNNEDLNGDGVLDIGEDSNGNGLLDPGPRVLISSNFNGIKLQSGKVRVVNTEVRNNVLNGIEIGQDESPQTASPLQVVIGEGLSEPSFERRVDGDFLPGSYKIKLANVLPIAVGMEVDDLDGDVIAPRTKVQYVDPVTKEITLDKLTLLPLSDNTQLRFTGLNPKIRSEASNAILSNGQYGIRFMESIRFLDEDSNNNGFLDPDEDANRNGLLDTEDTNGNGVLDPGEDTNANGVLDTEDANGNGRLDAEDINGNEELDVPVLLQGNYLGKTHQASTEPGNLRSNYHAENESEDNNGNGVLDIEDTNGNGELDVGEDLNGNGVLDDEDTNGNGELDLGNTVLIPSEDLNGNGVLDFGEDLNRNGSLDIEDINGNGLLDLGEDVVNGVLDVEDTNGNGVLDPGEDTNGNGVLDDEDTNGNGVLDPGEDVVNGVLDTEDLNGNGVFDTEDLNGDGVLDLGNGSGLRFHPSFFALYERDFNYSAEASQYDFGDRNNNVNSEIGVPLVATLPPTSLSWEPGRQLIRLSWIAPDTNSSTGSISRYQIHIQYRGQEDFVETEDASTRFDLDVFRDNRLTDGEEYQVSVAAMLEDENGSPLEAPNDLSSFSSFVIAIPAQPAGAPVRRPTTRF